MGDKKKRKMRSELTAPLLLVTFLTGIVAVVAFAVIGVRYLWSLW